MNRFSLTPARRCLLALAAASAVVVSGLAPPPQPSRFGPGKTDEPFPLEDEIEFYADTNGGTDRLFVGTTSDMSESQDLTVGNGGLSWTGDGDPDVVGMPFDEVGLIGGSGVESLSGQGGRGAAAPLSNATEFEATGNGGGDLIKGSDIAGGDTLDGGGSIDSIDAAAGDDLVYQRNQRSAVKCDPSSSGSRDATAPPSPTWPYSPHSAAAPTRR